METTRAHHTLQTFRHNLYQALGQRRDALFELTDAVLAAPGRQTAVQLSLQAPFRRRWSSAPDALAAGTLQVDRCGALTRAALERQVPAGRAIWALDGTVWPR